MDYSKHYNLLIEKARARTPVGYTETHHIKPKCIGGGDEKENLVKLYPEEHYLAHQLLVKMYPTHAGLLSAAMMMTAKRSGNKVYGWLRRRWSEHMRSNNPVVLNPACNARKGRRLKGTYSEEERRALSERMTAKNPMHGVKPWLHPRATEETKSMWKRADDYYQWWYASKLQHGQNAMARAFGENYKMTHANLVKYFRSGWVPTEDPSWLSFKESDSCKI